MMLILLIYLIGAISLITECNAKDLNSIVLKGGVDIGSLGILEDWSTAYRINDPDLSFSLEGLSASATIKALTKETLDFGIAVQGFDQSVKRAHPNLFLFPLFLTAFCPIYQLDSLSLDTPLVFSRQTLFKIMIGDVINWSDRAIQSDNPTVALPNLNITVILDNGSLGKHYIIKNALRQFNESLFNQSSLTLSDEMDFDLNAYAAYKLVELKETALVTAVLGTNGAFGLSYYTTARALGAAVGSMINRAGMTVSVSAKSMSYAAIDQAVVQSNSQINAQVLTDSIAIAAWPLTLFANLAIDSQLSPASCKARESLVEFFLYVYQSGVALSLMQSRGLTSVPELLIESSDVINFLTNQVQCHGKAALPVQAVAQRTLGVSQHLQFFANLMSAVYTDQGVEWVAQSVYDDVLITCLANSEIDLAIVNQDGVDPDTWQALIDTDEFLILPMGAASVSLVFNPQLSDSVSLISSNPLLLDDSLIAQILTNCINTWNNPQLLALNPWISALTYNAPYPVIKLIGCGALNDINAAPLGFAMMNYIKRWASDPSNTLDPGAVCANRFFGDPTATASWYSCQTNQSQLTGFGREHILDSVLVGQRWTVAISMVDNDSFKLYPRLVHTKDGESIVVRSDVDHILACAQDSFDAQSVTFDLHHSKNCWPLLQQYHLVVRRQYYSPDSVTNSSNCQRGGDALQFLYYILASDYSNSLTRSLNLGTFFRLPGVAARYSEQLNSVLCDDETLYITLPIVWSLHPGLEFVAIAASAIGILFTIGLIIFTIKYRLHAVIRASSPVFMVLSLVGVMMLFAAVIAFVVPVSSSSCAVFAWLANLGVQMAFAPLIFKALRIYMIFAKRKLSVIKLSNRKLLSWTAVSIGIELLLLSIWQAVSPEQPYTNIRIEGTSAKVHQYTQCSAHGSGSALLGIVIAYKIALLLFGCLLAFGTRKVTSKFNESSEIAIAIYNLTFVTFVIGVILAMIDVNGNAEVGMITFASLWVAFCTASLLVVPKMLHVLRPDSEEPATEGPSQASNGGFSFLSVDDFNTVAVLNSYITALKRHLEIAETKLSALKKKTGSSSNQPKIELQSARGESSKQTTMIDNLVSARGPASKSVSVSLNQLRVRPQVTSTIASVALASPASTSTSLHIPASIRSRKLSTKVEADDEEKDGD